MKKSAIIGLCAGGAALVALGATYFAGRNYYQTHIYPGTVINGIDCSNMTIDMAKEEMQYEMDNYTLNVSERGGLTDTIKGKEIDLLFTDSGKVDEILAGQNAPLWFTRIIGSKDYDIGNDFTYAEDKTEQLVGEFQCFKPENVTEPENAKAVLKDKGFEVEPELEGSLVELPDVIRLVKEAIDKSELSLDLEEAGVYKEPSVRKDNPDLLKEIDGMNAMLQADITYDFVDTQFHVEKEDLAQWVSMAEDGSVIVDREKVADWVRNMAYETDTFGLAKEFTTSYGHTITLEGGGDYGYCIDQEDTVEQLIGFVQEGQTVTTEPVYLYTAMDRRGNTIGNSYVEICISTQTLWLYWNGELICSTPVITGCDAKGYSTPSGSVWAIDGKKDEWWFTTFPDAYSKWWMPFNDECGLHDARWQMPEYYATPGFYINNGSHGCVNIPDDAMEQIFYYMEIGYPVVCYFSEDQVHGPDPTEALIAG